MAIFKRVGRDGKTTRWQVVIDVEDDLTGKRKRRVVGTFRLKELAEKAERTALMSRDEGTLLEKDSTTVAQLLDRWLAVKATEVSSNSLADYRGVIEKHVKPALGTVPIRKLTPAMLQTQYATWRDAGLSARMIRGAHMRLSQSLDFAVRMKQLLHNPAKDVAAPKLPRSSFNCWDADEARRFLQAAKSDHYAELWGLLVREGVRRGEGLGLRWRDVDFAQGAAHIRQTVSIDKSRASGKASPVVQSRTKTKAGSRTVTLTATTLAELRALRDRRMFGDNEALKPVPDGLVSCTRDGKPLNPANIGRNLDAIVKRAGLKRLKVHELRHTSATLALLAGTPAKVVSERLGHASIAITLDIYSAVLPSMQHDAAAAMDRLLG